MKKTAMMLLAVSILLIACTASSPETVNQFESQTEEELLQPSNSDPINSDESDQAAAGYGPAQDTHHSTITTLTDSDISQAEIEGLMFMREEEKLARDIYLYFSEIWNMNIFSNISRSEVTHMEAVLTLLNLYDIDDPVSNNGIGVFTNQDLQALYENLTTSGSQSLVNALIVGGAVEEIDILDLQEYLAISSNDAVSEVYENLLKGSINHLRSFSRIYEKQTGEEYQPQFLSQEEYADLLDGFPSNITKQGRGYNSSAQGKNRSW